MNYCFGYFEMCLPIFRFCIVLNEKEKKRMLYILSFHVATIQSTEFLIV